MGRIVKAPLLPIFTSVQMGRWQTLQAADGGEMPRISLGRNVAKARQLRRSLSLPERMLWLRIKGADVHFRKQHPIGPYVLDFYCAAAKLAIEVDGFAHDTGDRPLRDEARTSWLEDQGLAVLRLPAKDLLANPDDVADALIRLCADRAIPLHQPAAGSPPHLCFAKMGRSE
jgi:very-short-patch-repair endonuclease